MNKNQKLWFSQQPDQNQDRCHVHTIEEFNVNWKAECDQLNLAHVTENNKCKKRNYNE